MQVILNLKTDNHSGKGLGLDMKKRLLTMIELQCFQNRRRKTDEN